MAEITPKAVMMAKYVIELKNPSPKVVISPADTLEKQYKELNTPYIYPFLFNSPYFSHAKWMYLPWLTHKKPAEQPASPEPEQDIKYFKVDESVRVARMPEL